MPTIEDGVEVYPYRPPAHQADATLSQVNPVSTTLYTVLDTTRNVRIISFFASVTWTGQPSPLDLVITIDGQTIVFTVGNPVNGQMYEFRAWSSTGTGGLLVAETLTTKIPFILEGRSVRVQVRTTGGITSSLDACVKWARWTP